MPTLGVVGAAAAAAEVTAAPSRENKVEAEAERTSPRGWRDFKVGDRCDARDRGWEWTECEVIAVKGRTIRVHFVGWSAEWDTWFDKDSSDLAVLHTQSRRSAGDPSSGTSSAMSAKAIKKHINDV